MTRPSSQSRAGLAARLRGATLDLTPLRVSRPYRRLLFGEAVSVIGTQVTTVAVPLQVYAQTRSTVAVGLQGASVAGGFAVLGVTAAVAATATRFRRYDAREPA